MADVTLDVQNSNPKELYGQGLRAFILQDYDTAVRAFSRSSELLAAEHDNETHDSLGDVYLYYGKSLLEISRKESGPLGEGVLKNVEEESEEEIEEEGDEENKDDKTAEGENTEKKVDSKNEGEDKEETEAEVNGDEKTEDAANSEDEEKKEDKTEEETAEASGSTEKKGETEEELTDLQVAWEVLELAKSIFTSRGDDGKKSLADTLIVLGEISLESGNYASAIEDVMEGLKIQKTLFGDDSRTIAETYYKLGGAYATNGQIEEAIESFTSSLQYVKNKVTSLEKDEKQKEANAEEIEELKQLIPEIEEKVADMQNLKTEIANKVTTSAEETAPKANGTSEASSSKPVNNISHLVKRKRKEDESDPQNEKPAKKPSP